jgi:lipoprotein-anchoring transpeptidase ErfK/SrfK
VQPLDTVGRLGVRGETSGCIRVLPEDAVRIWDWIAVGDEVHVIS